MQDSAHHNAEIAKCLVDLHGTCVVLPFHRQGLPYLSLAVIALSSAIYLLKRMGAREMNAPQNPYAVTEWQLLVGRFGLLFFTVATALDYIRLFLGSFDQSWPDYVLENMDDVSEANVEWAKHGYRDVGVQTFLWWYCCFLQTILLPLTLYSVSFIYYKARRRTDNPIEDPHAWFLKCSAVVVCIAVPSLVGFLLGTLQGPLKLIHVTGLWSLTTSVHHFWYLQRLSIFAWQAALVGLGIGLLTVEGADKRFRNIAFLLTNVLAFVCCFLVPLVVNNNDTWWPAVTRFLQQAAIASQLWADSTHNRDDYGRLFDDDYLPGHNAQQQDNSLRQPLLAADEQEVEEEHIVIDATPQEQVEEDEVVASESEDSDESEEESSEHEEVGEEDKSADGDDDGGDVDV
jgi:hypothetical protein